jgi:hypothetical protein
MHAGLCGICLAAAATYTCARGGRSEQGLAVQAGGGYGAGLWRLLMPWDLDVAWCSGGVSVWMMGWMSAGSSGEWWCLGVVLVEVMGRRADERGDLVCGEGGRSCLEED